MLKAVAFDLNGVVITESDYFTNRLAKKYGLPSGVFYNIFKEVIRIARQPGCDDFFKLWQPGLKALGLLIPKEEFFDLWFSNEKLVPVFLEYFKDLRARGTKIFILSNNFKERTSYYRQNFPEIFEAVDQVYFSWETGFVKPDPQAYQNILTTNDLSADELVYFDNDDANIQAAKSLDIKAFKYQSLENTKQVISNLD